MSDVYHRTSRKTEISTAAAHGISPPCFFFLRVQRAVLGEKCPCSSFCWQKPFHQQEGLIGYNSLVAASSISQLCMLCRKISSAHCMLISLSGLAIVKVPLVFISLFSVLNQFVSMHLPHFIVKPEHLSRMFFVDSETFNFQSAWMNEWMTLTRNIVSFCHVAAKNLI